MNISPVSCRQFNHNVTFKSKKQPNNKPPEAPFTPKNVKRLLCTGVLVGSMILNGCSSKDTRTLLPSSFSHGEPPTPYIGMNTNYTNGIVDFNYLDEIYNSTKDPHIKQAIDKNREKIQNSGCKVTEQKTGEYTDSIITITLPANSKYNKYSYWDMGALTPSLNMLFINPDTLCNLDIIDPGIQDTINTFVNNELVNLNKPCNIRMTESQFYDALTIGLNGDRHYQNQFKGEPYDLVQESINKVLSANNLKINEETNAKKYEELSANYDTVAIARKSTSEYNEPLIDIYFFPYKHQDEKIANFEKLCNETFFNPEALIELSGTKIDNSKDISEYYIKGPSKITIPEKYLDLAVDKNKILNGMKVSENKDSSSKVEKEPELSDNTDTIKTTFNYTTKAIEKAPCESIRRNLQEHQETQKNISTMKSYVSPGGEKLVKITLKNLPDGKIKLKDFLDVFDLEDDALTYHNDLGLTTKFGFGNLKEDSYIVKQSSFKYDENGYLKSQLPKELTEKEINSVPFDNLSKAIEKAPNKKERNRLIEQQKQQNIMMRMFVTRDDKGNETVNILYYPPCDTTYGEFCDIAGIKIEEKSKLDSLFSKDYTDIIDEGLYKFDRSDFIYDENGNKNTFEEKVEEPKPEKETKPEVKPEKKPEVKPEQKPEVTPEPPKTIEKKGDVYDYLTPYLTNYSEEEITRQLEKAQEHANISMTQKDGQDFVVFEILKDEASSQELCNYLYLNHTDMVENGFINAQENDSKIYDVFKKVGWPKTYDAIPIQAGTKWEIPTSKLGEIIK